MNDDTKARLEAIQNDAIEHAIEEMEMSCNFSLDDHDSRATRFQLTKMASQSIGVAAKIEAFFAARERSPGFNGSPNSKYDADKAAQAIADKAEARLQARSGNVREFKRKIAGS